MKNIIAILTITLLLASCSAGRNENTATDVAGMKSSLKAKESQVTALKTEIDSLKKAIERLDPTFNKKELPVVELLQLQRGEFKHFVEVQGGIVPGETKYISSELPGKILKLAVNEGDRVNRGQFLASIDSESMQKSKNELNTSLELATDLFERQKRLWEKNIGSEIQYLQAKNTKERLEKSLETVEVSLRKSMIYAPMSGTITRLMSKKGEIASPGMPILEMINIRQVKVNADVPEVYLRDVKRKDIVNVKVPVLGLEKEVAVYRVGNVINANNRTFEVEVKLDNPKYELKPNLLAMIYINDYKAIDAVSVPLELVQQDVSGKNFVFSADKNGDKYFVKKNLITTGIAYDGRIEVLSGLEGSEQLVSIGSQYLAEGEEIKIIAE